jgi:hypothetical protein
MTMKTEPFLNGKWGWDLGENNWKTGADENFLKFSFMLNRNVDGFVASLPVSPVNGTAYFLTSDNSLNARVDGAWYKYPVPKGFEVIEKTTGTKYEFNGTSFVLTSGLADKVKLDGIASGATANASDASLRDRATHTGVQAQSTITGLAASLALKADLVSPALTGTPTAPTPSTADNTTKVATTAYVKAQGYLVTAPVTSVAAKTGAVTLDKNDVGLTNIDNTSDVNKPVSTAQQTALNLKANLASPTFTGTVVLPSTTSIGSLDSTELSYLNGVTSNVQAQINSLSGASGAFAPINNPTFTGTVGGITKAMVGLGNVDNTSDVNKPVSTAQQTALNAKITGTLTSSSTDTTAGRIPKVGDFGFGGSGVVITDCNAVVTDGWYSFSTGVLNAPIANGTLFVVARNSGRVWQLAANADGTTANVWYTRVYSGTTWSSWERTHHDGNQLALGTTAASARAVLGVDVPLGYTPVNKIGDTMTGGLVINAVGSQKPLSLKSNIDSACYFDMKNGIGNEIGYVGSANGGALSGYATTDFGIRSTGKLILRSDANDIRILQDIRAESDLLVLGDIQGGHVKGESTGNTTTGFTGGQMEVVSAANNHPTISFHSLGIFGGGIKMTNSINFSLVDAAGTGRAGLSFRQGNMSGPLTIDDTTVVSAVPLAVQANKPADGLWQRIINSSGINASVAGLSLDAGNNGLGVRDAQIRATNNGSNAITMSFWTANGAASFEAVTIFPNGNVGLGSTTNNGAKLNVVGSATFAGGVTTSGTFNGNGLYVTNLNATNITSGTLDDARLSFTYSALSNTPLALAQRDAIGGLYANSFHGAGFDLTGLNASNITTGTLAAGRLPFTYSTTATPNTMALRDATGIIAATSFSGGGGGLTALDAANIATGTLAAGRLPFTYTNAATANTVVFRDASGNTNINNLGAANVTAGGLVTAGGFIGNGGGITALSASNITNGTLPDARLSANVVTKATPSQLFQTITATGAVNINAALGIHVRATSTGATTWTFPTPTSNEVLAITIELTNGGAFVQTWPAGMQWSGGSAPTLTASGVDILVFTKAGTNNWRGYLASKDNK